MRVASGDQRGVSEIDRRCVDLVLVRAVVIHYPDFFVAALRAHVGDLRLRDSRLAAAEHADDVVGELMRQVARVGICRRAAVDFLQRQGRGGVAHVGKKPADRQIRCRPRVMLP